MSNRLPVFYQKKPCYDIVYSHNFEALEKELEVLQVSKRNVCIVTDSSVKELYANEVSALFSKNAISCSVFDFPSGEQNKTLDTVKLVYEFLIEKRFNRKDLLIALGGGVVGDLTGFVAATFLRGIDFIQIPTTLLSQVDSSIGGKTGVDFDQYKNMVGAFKMPLLVYINLSTLKTLSDRQYFSGMAEVMKSALIKDASFYEWIISNLYEIGDRESKTLEEMVFRTDQIKKMVVENDPEEQGERALLNFGHTIGHAIEKYKNFELSHGECVALGCVAASFLSMKRELLSKDEYYEIRDMFVPFQLPISIDAIDPQEILSLTKNDKKMGSNGIKFILLKKIGKAIIDHTVTDEELLEAINEIFYNTEELKND